jgi:hypothetical protein
MKLQERVFKQLFEVAEIAKFTQEERMAYEESLKYYRDMKNVIDTSREEGRKERNYQIALGMKKMGNPSRKSGGTQVCPSKRLKACKRAA